MICILRAKRVLSYSYLSQSTSVQIHNYGVMVVLPKCFFFFLFLARLLILIKKGGLLQLKFGVVGVGVNINLWAR